MHTQVSQHAHEMQLAGYPVNYNRKQLRNKRIFGSTQKSMMVSQWRWKALLQGAVDSQWRWKALLQGAVDGDNHASLAFILFLFGGY